MFPIWDFVVGIFGRKTMLHMGWVLLILNKQNKIRMVGLHIFLLCSILNFQTVWLISFKIVLINDPKITI